MILLNLQWTVDLKKLEGARDTKKHIVKKWLFVGTLKKKNATKLLKEENNFKFIMASTVFNLFVLLAKNMSYKDM